MSILKFKKANCKNCYKCVRNCPVKAIEVKDHQAQIIDNDCILCGNCMLICPQNAKEVRSDTSIVKNLIREGKTVIASVAPSFISNYDVKNFKAFANALRKLGFSDVLETAEGAHVVKSKYEQMVDEHWNDTIISSCCPTVVSLIQKHYPEALKYLAPVLSPMQAHAKLIKERVPDAVVVFIGPCISKKYECEKYPGFADIAITFDELGKWFDEANVEFSDEDSSDAYLSRFFPINGGILNTMEKKSDYEYISIDTPENCIAALKEICDGNLKNCFIEMSACTGSCVNGPASSRHKDPALKARIRVSKSAINGDHTVDFEVREQLDLSKEMKSERISLAMPSERQIGEILKKMGKNKLEDELNCGTCGYPSCREKAIAVYFGKAEINMCLPFMRERAESCSDNIINATPNAIITVNTDLNVQQINAAACDIFGISDPSDIVGSPVSRIMDEYDFTEVITSDSGRMNKKAYLAEYGKYLEQAFIYDQKSDIVICIMQDVTKKELKHEKIIKEKNQAAEITDKIVEKQLRIVHEIASLLGETAAETKIALTDLKNTILMEEDEL